MFAFQDVPDRSDIKLKQWAGAAIGAPGCFLFGRD
jgi:hypothetical protein